MSSALIPIVHDRFAADSGKTKVLALSQRQSGGGAVVLSKAVSQVVTIGLASPIIYLCGEGRGLRVTAKTNGYEI
jgi:hypothetical protein